MLRQLQINNVAVIEHATAEFGSKFNVLSGETGAGKTLLIDSINMVLGERAHRDIIRNGKDFASVSAVFFTFAVDHLLHEWGIPCEEDGTVILKRTIYADGRNACLINGNTVTLSQLKEIGSKLVTIHGQHDNQELLRASSHLQFLDDFAVLKNDIEEYREAYNKYIYLKKEFEKMAIDDNDREQKIDFLSYKVDEILKADLKIDEETELEKRRKVLMNAEKLAKSANEAYEAINGNYGAKDALYTVMKRLEESSNIDDKTAEMQMKAENLYYLSEELTHDIAAYCSNIEFNANEISEIEQRLDTIYKLKRKYGGSVEEVLDELEKATEELNFLKEYTSNIESLKGEMSKAYDYAYSLAKKLSDKRHNAADVLCAKVTEELLYLDMAKVTLQIGFENQEMGERGIDKVEFLISTSPGEAPKSLTKIASGGEMSRIMLSLKSVLSSIDPITVLLFDEIDTGVSGRAASRIADKLHSLAKNKQVICITHLPQIAAKGDTHLLIQKDTQGESFKTSVIQLDEKSREEEIARIIGGDIITETTLKNAREMLNSSKETE